MANYPSSASTDADLYVAVNSLATSLVGALTSVGGNNGADIEVTSTAGFPAAGFITIDQEAISYTSLLSSPARFSGITRGADGTTASSHSAGSTVKHNVIAAHHNVLKEEIKAIETDLLTGNPPLRQTGGTMTGTVLFPDGTATAPSVAFSGDTGVGVYRSGTSLGLASPASGSVQARVNNIQMLVANDTEVFIRGTNTNNNTSAGFVGEYVESLSTTDVAAAATSVTDDLVSISLTAGDWDVTGMASFDNNGATWSVFSLGITLVAGNTGVGTQGVQADSFEFASTSTTITRKILVVPNYRISLASTTTVYLKRVFAYSAGTPRTRNGRLSARRVR